MMKANNETDEVTLESWKAECKQMEEEMARDSAELRTIIAEAQADESLDPEMKKIILETGEKMLGADGWLKGIYAFTTDVIAHCDEMMAKVNAIEKNNKSKGEAKRRSRK